MRAAETIHIILLKKGKEPYFRYYGDISQKEQLDELLISIGVTDLPELIILPNGEPTTTYEYKFYIDTPEYLILKNGLSELQIPYSNFYTFEFTKKETERSPLYRYAMKEDYPDCKHPSEYGTKYEKKVICPACGLNKWTQVSDLHLDTSVISKRLILYKLGDNIKGGEFIIVSKEMVDLLNKASVTGYRLRPVIHVGLEEKRRDVYQLIPTNVLPLLAPEMHYERIPSEYCEGCDIKGRFVWPLHYRSSALTHAYDFNLTAELFDYGSAQQLVLVSKKIRELFHQHRVKAWLQPVIVVDG